MYKGPIIRTRTYDNQDIEKTSQKMKPICLQEVPPTEKLERNSRTTNID